MKSNSIAFIGLCNEYCQTIENARQLERHEFIAAMIRLIPRLYISANDLDSASAGYEAYIEPSLDEDYYESVRLGIEQLMGEDDVYLEVFEEDMKYSDTPIGASISESLADLFQSLFNFLEMVRDAPEELVENALTAIREDYITYWGQIACNVMRPLNALRTHESDEQ